MEPSDLGSAEEPISDGRSLKRGWSGANYGDWRQERRLHGFSVPSLKIVMRGRFISILGVGSVEGEEVEPERAELFRGHWLDRDGGSGLS